MKKLLLIPVCALFTWYGAAAEVPPPETERAGAPVPVAEQSPSKRLAVVESRLAELGRAEREARNLWMERQRVMVDVRQEVLRTSEEAQAIQARMTELLEEVQALQQQLQRLILASGLAAGDEEIESQDVLQQRVETYRVQRQALLRERQSLQQELDAQAAAAANEAEAD